MIWTTVIKRQLLSPKLLNGSVRRSRPLINSYRNHSNAEVNTSSNQHQNESPHNSIEITNAQRIILSVGSSVAALINPHR